MPTLSTPGRSRPARVRIVAALGAAAVAVTTLGACSASKTAVDQTAGTEYRFDNATNKGELIAEADRKKPGNVSGPLLSGNGSYQLSQDAGKVVVVNLWGTWCGPCKVETPMFQQIYEQLKPQGVTFVGFDVKEPSTDKPQNFVTDNGITYPIVHDPETKVALQLGQLPIQGLPLTALVDKQGRVAAVYVGPVKPSELKPALATLVAEN